MAKYIKPKPGEWIQPIRKGYKLACCDCGLVHKMNFRVAGKFVQFQAFRDYRATAAVRRHYESIRVIKQDKPMKKDKGKKPVKPPKKY